MRGQQRAGLCFAFAKRIEIGGQDVLQKVLGIQAGNGDERAVFQQGKGHGENKSLILQNG
ncbi:hypothetical protein MesoLj113c_54210 [Mesorhizobium sp. 113-3-9]|nr:hypothetical protein MesoLj113c_54210 [Mesorhizobium sp. 113-3-9]